MEVLVKSQPKVNLVLRGTWTGEMGWGEGGMRSTESSRSHSIMFTSVVNKYLSGNRGKMLWFYLQYTLSKLRWLIYR